MSIVEALHEKVAAICPIIGVSIVDMSDKKTWRIDFNEVSTAAQRKAAINVVAAFDPTSLDEPEPNVEEKVGALVAEIAALEERLLRVEKR